MDSDLERAQTSEHCCMQYYLVFSILRPARATLVRYKLGVTGCVVVLKEFYMVVIRVLEECYKGASYIIIGSIDKAM